MKSAEILSAPQTDTTLLRAMLNIEFDFKSIIIILNRYILVTAATTTQLKFIQTKTGIQTVLIIQTYCQSSKSINNT